MILTQIRTHINKGSKREKHAQPLEQCTGSRVLDSRPFIAESLPATSSRLGFL